MKSVMKNNLMYKVIVLGFIFGISGCGGGGGTAPVDSAASVPAAGGSSTSASSIQLQVLPAVGTVTVGSSLALKAEARNANRQVMFSKKATTPVTLTWSSSNPLVATVDQFGNVTAIGTGNVRITATSGTIVANTDLAVVSGGVSVGGISNLVKSITVSPKRSLLTPGASSTLNVFGSDMTGAPTSLGSCGAGGASLSASEAGVVSATYDGTLGAEKITVTALQNGFTYLTFSCNGLSAAPIAVEVSASTSLPTFLGGAQFLSGLQFDIYAEEFHVAGPLSGATTSIGYALFKNGVWSSEIIPGFNGMVTVDAIHIDPRTSQPVIVDALNSNVWVRGVNGGWTSFSLGTTVRTSYRDSLMTDNGALYIFGYNVSEANLFVSLGITRNDWVTQNLAGFGSASKVKLSISPITGDLFIGFELYTYNATLKIGQDTTHYAKINSVTQLVDVEFVGNGQMEAMAIGKDNRPHFIIVDNQVMNYTRKENGVWVARSIISPAWNNTNFELDAHELPRISYYDGTAIKLLSRETGVPLGQVGGWSVDTVAVGVGQHAYVLDEYDRAIVLYINAGTPKLYIEPHYLDYSPRGASSVELPSNLSVSVLQLPAPTGITATAFGSTTGAVRLSSANIYTGSIGSRVYYSTTGNPTFTDPYISGSSLSYAGVTVAYLQNQALDVPTYYGVVSFTPTGYSQMAYTSATSSVVAGGYSTIYIDSALSAGNGNGGINLQFTTRPQNANVNVYYTMDGTTPSAVSPSFQVAASLDSYTFAVDVYSSYKFATSISGPLGVETALSTAWGPLDTVVHPVLFSLSTTGQYFYINNTRDPNNGSLTYTLYASTTPNAIANGTVVATNMTPNAWVPVVGAPGTIVGQSYYWAVRVSDGVTSRFTNDILRVAY